jgi:hypothetical protein
MQWVSMPSTVYRYALAAPKGSGEPRPSLIAWYTVSAGVVARLGDTTGWYEPPYRALYTVTIAGCGKNTTYLVGCDNKRNRCATGTASD